MAGDVGREGGMGLREKSQEVGRGSIEDAPWMQRAGKEKGN